MALWIAIFIGGGLGSLSRYGFSRWLGNADNGFPTATLLANIAACLILGLISALVIRKWDLSPTMQAAILTGFCGGFSTFSTFSMESISLLQGGKAGLAFAYMGISLVACLGAIAIGVWLGTKWSHS